MEVYVVLDRVGRRVVPFNELALSGLRIFDLWSGATLDASDLGALLVRHELLRVLLELLQLAYKLSVKCEDSPARLLQLLPAILLAFLFRVEALLRCVNQGAFLLHRLAFPLE